VDADALDGLDITLRPATEADFEYLFDLNMATIRVYAEQVYGPHDEAAHRRIFHERFPPGAIQIVVVDGQDAGMLQLEPDGDSVQLANIRVAPEYQGRGIGTRLIQGVLKNAYGRGQSVTLRVFKVNPARFLYERLGFVVVGATETHILMEARPPTPKAR
jgi:ribosomal protein S18 acetylase RimI-like enzyme